MYAALKIIILIVLAMESFLYATFDPIAFKKVPYRAKVLELDLCSGFKKENLSEVHVNLTEINGVQFFSGEGTVFHDAGPVMMMSRVFGWKNNKFEKLITFNSKNVCEYRDAVNSLMMCGFKFTDLDGNCILKKGKFAINNIEPNKLLHLVLGERSFIATFKTIITFYTAKKHILCVKHVIQYKAL